MKPSLFSFALLTAFYIVSSPFAVAGVSFGTPITSRTPNPAFLTPIGPVIIDADSNGNADIVTADFSGSARYISYGNADGSARSSLTYAEPNQPYAMASADLNADGLPDLIFSSGGAIQYYLSENGSYQFRRELASPALFPVSLGTADFNGDGFADIVASGNASMANDTNLGRVEIYLSTSAGGALTGYSDPQVFSAGTNGGRLAVGNLNSDTFPDVAVTSPNGELGVTILFGDSTGAANGTPLLIQPQSVPTFRDIPTGIAIGDVSGDGRAEIWISISIPHATENSYTSWVSVIQPNSEGVFFLGQGFLVTTDEPGFARGSGIAIADLDGDGKQDVATVNYADPNLHVLRLSAGNDGSFTTDERATIFIPNSAHLLTVGDLNRDTKPDVVIAHSDGNGLTTLLNTSGAAAVTGKQVAFDTNVYPATEGDNVNVIVRRGPDSTGQVSVPFTVSGTATPSGQTNSDFIVAAPRNPQTVVFADGEREKTIFIALSSNAGGEPDETVILTLGSPVGDAILGTPAATTLTIKDTETANSGLSVTPPESRTTGLPWTFSVTKPSAASGLKVRVQSALAAGAQATWAWKDLPGGGAMTRNGNTWSLTTISIPVGARSFRSIASATGVSDSISAPTAVFNVAQGKILRLVAKASSASDRTGRTTRPGEVLNYELRYYNTSAAPATNVVVSASTPEATDFDSAQGDWRKTTNGVKWKLGTVPAYSEASVFFSVRVSSKARVGTDIGLLQATISGNQNGAALPVTKATPVRSLVQSLFVVSAATTATEVGPGGLVTYTFTVRNDSGASMRDVQLSYKIENGSAVSAIFLNAKNQPTGSPIAAPGGGPNPGIDARGETVTWYFGKLPPLSVRHVRLKVRVWYDLPLNKPLLGGALTGTYLDSDDRLKSSSPKFAPELAPTGVAPTASPRLSLLKGVIDGSGPNDDPDFVLDPDRGIINAVQPGRIISMELFAYNGGGATARRSVIKDRLPAGTVLVNDSVKINNESAGSRFRTEDNGKTLLFSVGDLTPNANASVEYQLKALKRADGGLQTNAVIESVGANIASASLGATPSSSPEVLPIKIVAPVNLILSRPESVPEQPEIGEETTYTIGYRNEGGTMAEGVVLTAELPSDTSLVSARFLNEEPSRSINTMQAGTVFFNLNQVAPEEQGFVRVVVRVNESAANSDSSKVLSHRFSIKHSKSPAPNSAPVKAFASLDAQTAPPPPVDHVTDYNRVSATGPQLCIVRMAPTTVLRHREFQYLITIGNYTEFLVADQILVSFTLPPGVEYVSSGTSDGENQFDGGGVQNGVFSVYFNGLFKHKAKSVTVTLRATGAADSSIVDNTCSVESASFSVVEFASVLAGTTSTYIEKPPSYSLTYVRDPGAAVGAFVNATGGGTEAGVVTPDFVANSGRANRDTRSIVVGGADFFQVYHGSVLIPLGGNQIIAAGSTSIISGGAGNIIANDGASIISGGAGNLTTFMNMTNAKGENFIDQTGADVIAGIISGGAGNIISGGAGNIISGGAGNIIANDGASLVGNDGSSFGNLADLKANIISGGAGNIISGGAGNIISGGAGNIISGGAGNAVAIGGSTLINANGVGLTSNDISRAVFAGANGTIISGGGGNIISGGAGNIVAGGAGN